MMSDRTPTPHEAGQIALAEVTRSALKALRLAEQNLRNGEATSGAAKRVRESANLLSRAITSLAAAAERTSEKIENSPPNNNGFCLEDSIEFLRRAKLMIANGTCPDCNGILPNLKG